MQLDDDFNADRILLIFGANIKKARVQRNMTIGMLAKEARYDRGCLSKLEKGLLNIQLATAVKLAETLDVSFPALFSRNFMRKDPDANIDFCGNFRKDDYFLIFRENFGKQLHKYNMMQVSVKDITEVTEQMVSRIVHGVNKNPTLKTLYALAFTVSGEMYSLFSRTEWEENI